VDIAFFTESYWPVTNGVSTSVETFRQALELAGHRVFIFAPRFPGHKDDPDRIVRYPSYRLPFQRDYPISYPFSPGAARKFASIAPDVVHTMSPFVLGKVGRNLARRHGLPLVSTNHTLYTEYTHYARVFPTRLAKAYMRFHLRRYYNQCDRVVVPSAPVRDLLISYGVTTGIDVVATGIPKTWGEPSGGDEIRRRFGIGDEEKVLSYVGRLAKEKNLEMMLDAFAIVQAERPDTRLLIAGSGPYLEECKESAAGKSLSHKVVFAGFLPPDEVRKCYDATSVLLHPSMTETQGLALGEAMQAGIPGVAVGAFGGTETIVDGVSGYLTPDDPKVFAKRVLELLNDDDLRHKMGEAAKERMKEFTTEASAAKLISIYEELLAQLGRKT
jgi:1,2-diacylglycerol 3-alpha-glucosyltransferase